MLSMDDLADMCKSFNNIAAASGAAGRPVMIGAETESIGSKLSKSNKYVGDISE